MKKLSFILLSAISLLNLVSCDKKSKGTNCPAKQCAYGMNPATCECNPNPNDTTTNPVDTGTIQPLKSKFGNGSNGTVDTTVNWAIGKPASYWEENDFQNFRDVFRMNSYNDNYIVTQYEVEIDGKLRGSVKTDLDSIANIVQISYSPYTPTNTYRPSDFKFSLVILDIDSIPMINGNVADLVNKIEIPFYKISETNASSFLVYRIPEYTFNFPKEACRTQGLFDSQNLYQEYAMKLQILSNTPTDKRFYTRIYIKHDNIKYVIKAEIKKV